MKALLKLECIGDNWGLPAEAAFWVRVFNDGQQLPRRYWVAEIVGRSPRYGYERKFLPCKKDYRDANSAGTRGVYAYYILDEGQLYEVSAPRSWRRTDRYFCTVKNGEIVRLTEEEAEAWLNDHLG